MNCGCGRSIAGCFEWLDKELADSVKPIIDKPLVSLPVVEYKGLFFHPIQRGPPAGYPVA